MLFCHAARISQHRQNFSSHRFVCLDRLNTSDWRPGQKSLRHKNPRVRFWMSVSSSIQHDYPWIADISANPDPFLAWIRVRTVQTPLIDGQGRNRSAARACEVNFQWEPPPCFRKSDPMNRWYLSKFWPLPRADSCFRTAQTPLIDGQSQIAPPRGPKRTKSESPLMLQAQCRGTATSVDILASTSLLHARLLVYGRNFRVRYDAWGTWLVSTDTDFVVRTPHFHCQFWQ